MLPGVKENKQSTLINKIMKRIVGEPKSGQGLRRSDSTCVFYRALPHPFTGYLRDDSLIAARQIMVFLFYYISHELRSTTKINQPIREFHPPED